MIPFGVTIRLLPSIISVLYQSIRVVKVRILLALADISSNRQFFFTPILLPIISMCGQAKE